MDEQNLLYLSNYIGGSFVEHSGQDWMDVLEPATGQVYGRVPLSDSKTIDSAVEAATEAQPGWSSLSPDDRADWLDKIADYLEWSYEEIATLESRDTGKPISLARSLDASRSVTNFRFFASMIREQEPEIFETDDSTNYVLYKPVGVGALITPWNLPLYLLSWKVAPAIGMGNTVVCKPSELTPMTADLLMRAVDSVGLPAGVVNLVHGDGIGAGVPLVEHPDVDLVSFTGGTTTGEKVASSAAPMFKTVSLELGGKNSSIVFADCDMEVTIAGVVRSGFLNQGQVCLCGSRVLVEDSIYDEFEEKFVEAVEALTIGDPSDESTQLGALRSKEHLQKV